MGSHVVRPLALQCLVLGLLVVIGLAVLPRLSTRVHANALFHSGASSDPWGRPWVRKSDPRSRSGSLTFSTGADGVDDQYYRSGLGWSDSDTLQRRLIDDIFIVRPDDFRLLGAKILVGLARVAAACLLVLGFVSFPLRARSSWLIAGVWVVLVAIPVTRGVTLLVEFRRVRDFLTPASPAALPIPAAAVSTLIGGLGVVVASAVVTARARSARRTATASVAPAAP